MKVKELLESRIYTTHEFADEVRMKHAINNLKINGWKVEHPSDNVTKATLRDIAVTITKTGNKRSNGDNEYRIDSNEIGMRIS